MAKLTADSMDVTAAAAALLTPPQTGVKTAGTPGRFSKELTEETGDVGGCSSAELGALRKVGQLITGNELPGYHKQKLSVVEREKAMLKDWCRSVYKEMLEEENRAVYKPMANPRGHVALLGTLASDCAKSVSSPGSPVRVGAAPGLSVALDNSGASPVLEGPNLGTASSGSPLPGRLMNSVAGPALPALFEELARNTRTSGCAPPLPDASAPMNFQCSPDQAAALANMITSALREQTPVPATAPHRLRVKVSKYDGSTEWELYWKQFQFIAQANQWTEAEMAVQLIAALEGDACRVLFDVSVAEMTDPHAIARAVERQFGDPTLPSAARRRFNERKRKPGEKLGVYAAELRHLAQKAFPEFTEEQRCMLAKEAFISGLAPHTLRLQVRLANPPSWERVLEYAQEVEQILAEGAEPATAPATSVRAARPPAFGERPDPRPLVCWNCGQRGHTQYRCPAPRDPAPNHAPGTAHSSPHPQQGNAAGTA